MLSRSRHLKDKFLRRKYASIEISGIVLKALLSDVYNFSKDDRFYFFFRFSRIFINNSISFLRGSCVISGYSKSVFRRFFLCRHVLKRLSSGGFVTGMRKSSF